MDASTYYIPPSYHNFYDIFTKYHKKWHYYESHDMNYYGAGDKYESILYSGLFLLLKDNDENVLLSLSEDIINYGDYNLYLDRDALYRMTNRSPSAQILKIPYHTYRSFEKKKLILPLTSTQRRNIMSIVKPKGT